MGRVESGKMELELAPANLVKTLDEVRDLFATQMKTKKLDFTVTADVTNRTAICDKNRLNRILLNLLSNAFKFTPEGGSVSVKLIQIGAGEDMGYYQLRVKDTGIGMSPEFAATVFEAFTRERTAEVAGIQGTGLGMAITKSIVDLMGGKIDVITEKKKGTEFVIHVAFPLAEDLPEEEETRESGAAETDTGFAGMRILLVEDNAINREIAMMILNELGFRVETAEDGRIAVDKVEASQPGYYDGVLMDIQMPVMNGYDAAKAIRSLADKKLAAVPIIAMTANAFAEDVQAARDAGMNGHIAKPINIPQMVATLKETLTH
jgi:CheY-like chemotaxis protein/two-component sensor histidine kinase